MQRSRIARDHGRGSDLGMAPGRGSWTGRAVHQPASPKTRAARPASASASARRVRNLLFLSEDCLNDTQMRPVVDTKERDIQKAIFIAKKNLAGLVYDFQTIEGMPFTLPEVQTYLQGITVGGHKVSDEKKLNQQALAWKRLIELVETNEFRLNKELACELEGIVAKDEALFAGVFRDGMVTVAGRERPLPEACTLDELFNKLCRRVNETNDVLEKGFMVSLDIANQQYFWDGNKRTGILLMNGILISNGYMPLSIPAKRILEYNTKMHRFHNTGEEGEMMRFLSEIYEKEYPGFPRSQVKSKHPNADRPEHP